MGAIAVGHLGVFLEDVIMDRATSIQCGSGMARGEVGYEMQREGGEWVGVRCGDEGVAVELHGLIAKPTLSSCPLTECKH